MTATPSTHTVTLSRTSRRLIIVEAQAAAAQDLEVGGGLYGQPSFGSSVSVGRAETPGPNSRAKVDSLAFHYDDLEADEYDGSRLLGFWHSHPNNGEIGLSRADIEAFSSIKNHWRTAIPNFVALVVTPDPRDGWDKPQINGWRFHLGERYGRSTVLHEPVTISLWGSEPDSWPQPTPVKIRSSLEVVATPVATRSRSTHTSTRRPRRAATQRDANAWMVCTRDFTAIYYGRVEEHEAGKSFIRASHELVSRYPDAWKYDRERTEREKRSGGADGVIRFGGTVSFR